MTLRLTTWNVNGLRGALECGFGGALARLAPDVLLLQEIRALPEQLEPAWADPPGWDAAWHPAERKGYAGVATWSRWPLERLGTGLDGGPDPDGRVLRTRVGEVELVNIYLPSGSRSPERQAVKDAFLEQLEQWASALVGADHPVVIAGDLNVAPTADDLFNPTANRSHSGFLPHEREWFARLLEAGWTDVVRAHFGARKGPYSWWSNLGKARQLDRGWRIDHILANPAAARVCSGVHIDRASALEISDHAPLTVELAVDVARPVGVLRAGCDGEGEQTLKGGATKRKGAKTAAMRRADAGSKKKASKKPAGKKASKKKKPAGKKASKKKQPAGKKASKKRA